MVKQKAIGDGYDASTDEVNESSREHTKDDIIKVGTIITTKFINAIEEAEKLPQLSRKPVESLKPIEFQTFTPASQQIKSLKIGITPINISNSAPFM